MSKFVVGGWFFFNALILAGCDAPAPDAALKTDTAQAETGAEQSYAVHNFSEFHGDLLLKVALVQLDSSEVGDWAAIESYISSAQQSGAAFVVFPEGALYGWLNPQVFYSADPVPGAATAKLASLAQKYTISIVFGMAQQGPYVPGTNPAVYQPYDAAVLVNPLGQISIDSRKVNVLNNAFDPAQCPDSVKDPSGGCSYYPGDVSAIPVIRTALGKTAVIVCADAYTYNTNVLAYLKSQNVDTIFVVWGVAASSQAQCGSDGFNAAGFASGAAEFTGAMVIGANATGNRPYGRFLPSIYCGFSGIAASDGTIIATAPMDSGIYVYQVPIPK